MALFCAWRDRRFGSASTETAKNLLNAVPLANPKIYNSSVGQIEFAAFALANTLHEADEQVSISENLIRASHGLLWRPDAGAAKPVRASAIGSLGREPLGSHSTITIARGMMRAESDVSGLFHCYYVDEPDLVAISNSLHLIAALADARINTRAGAWLAATGYLVAGNTPYKGIHAVPLGYSLHWSTREGFEIKRKQHAPIFSLFSSDRGFAKSHFDEQAPSAIAEASSALTVANADQIRLPITGGKDSRLVLALCLAAGMKDRMTLFTRGMSDHPDVIVGKMVADAVGVPHEIVAPSPSKEIPIWPAEKIVGDIAQMTALSAGALGGWDLMIPRRHNRTSIVTGHVGEVLKAFAKRPFQRTDDPFDIVRLQSPCDPMGILRPNVADEMREELRAQWQPFQASVEFADIPDIFYYLNRIPNWFGNICQLRAFDGDRIAPLSSPTLLRMALSMRADQRKAELLHYFLIKKLAPQILGIPFAMQVWNEAIAAYDPNFQSTEAIPMPSSSKTPPFGNWHVSVNRDQSVRKGIRDTLARENPIWDELDREKLMTRLDSPGALSLREMVSLYGLLAAFLHARQELPKVVIR